MDNQSKPTKSGGNSGLLLLVGALVVAILVLLFLMQQNLAGQKANYEGLLKDRKEEYEKNLKKLSEDLQTQIAKAKQLGDEKQELVDSLEKVFKEIQADRTQLRQTLQATQSQLKQYKEKIDAYEILLRTKDKEIERLRETADILYKENTDLKGEKNNLISDLSEEKKRKEQLESRVSEAAVLKAENVNVNALDNRGKETSGGQYRASRIEKLVMTFNFADNKLAKIGSKEVFMRLLEPAGTLLINPGSSGTFPLDGREMQYTARQQVLFDNSRQKVVFQFARTGEYQPGRHTVEFYCEGRRIGLGAFEVR